MTRVRSNTLAMAGAFVTQAVFVFLQIKILTHALTPSQFGIFSSVFALGALLGSVAELGFSVVLVRYGALFEAQGRPRATRALLRAALGLWMAAGATIAVLLFAASGAVTRRFDQPGITAPLLLLGFFALLSFSLRAYSSAAFQASRRMMPALIMEMAYMGGITLLFFVMRHQLTVTWVFLALLGWSTLVGAAGLVGVFRLMGRAGEPVADPPAAAPAAGRPESSGAVLREIRSFWGGAAVTTAVAIALENADRLVLAAIVPFSQVAAYHVAGRINLFTRKVLFIPQQVAQPELTHRAESGEGDPLRRDLILFSKLEWVLALSLAVPVALAARVGVLLASNSAYLAAEPVLVALAGALPILCLQAPLTTFLRASGRIWVSVGAELIWLGTALLAGVALLARFGLAGFAVGQIVAASLSLLYTSRALKRMGLPGPPGRFLALHALAGLLLWVAAALVTRRWPILSFAPAALWSALFLVALNVVLVRFRFLSADEEARLLRMLGPGRWGRLGRALLEWPRLRGRHATI